MKTLRITEIFHSIQGESTRAGRPSAFIRLAGCNLDCDWCDTRYARGDKGRELPLPMILEAIRPFGAKLAAITGGEPLLQPAVVDLCLLLDSEGYKITVETNGSVDVSVLPHCAAKIMDLKPPSSGMANHNRLANFAHLGRGDEIKFVLADRMDYEWAKTMMASPDYPAGRVETLLSPVQGRLAAADLAAWILEDKLTARLNLQLHRIIWPGQDRGV